MVPGMGETAQEENDVSWGNMKTWIQNSDRREARKKQPGGWRVLRLAKETGAPVKTRLQGNRAEEDRAGHPGTLPASVCMHRCMHQTHTHAHLTHASHTHLTQTPLCAHTHTHTKKWNVSLLSVFIRRYFNTISNTMIDEEKLYSKALNISKRFARVSKCVNTESSPAWAAVTWTSVAEMLSGFLERRRVVHGPTVRLHFS